MKPVIKPARSRMSYRLDTLALMLLGGVGAIIAVLAAFAVLTGALGVR